MNFIVGMMLRVSGGDEVGSFQSFLSLSFHSEFMMIGIFEAGLPLVRFLEVLFQYVFEKTLPALKKHFDAEGVQPQLYLSKWLMTLYLYNFPLKTCLRIIDYFLSSNIFALVYVAIGILKQLEHVLLKLDGIELAMFFSTHQGNNEALTDKAELIAENSMKMIDVERAIQIAKSCKVKDEKVRELAEKTKAIVGKEYA